METLSSFCENNTELGKLLTPQIIQILYTRIEDFQQTNILFEDTDEEVRINFISWNTLASKPFFSETVFQILASMSSRLVKLAGALCADDISLSMTITKVKNVKSVCQSLLNISKYFAKIGRQLEEKDKKGKDPKGSNSIREFLAFYQAKNEEYLYLVKSPAKLEKMIQELKERIANLKNKIQN